MLCECMSDVLVVEVWKQYPEGGPVLCVLQALAEASNDRGNCYLTMAQIAAMARVSLRSALRAIQHLRRDRWIVTSRMLGRGATLVYQINLPKLRRSSREGCAVGSSAQETGATGDDLAGRVALRQPVIATAVDRAFEETASQYLAATKEAGSRQAAASHEDSDAL